MHDYVTQKMKCTLWQAPAYRYQFVNNSARIREHFCESINSVEYSGLPSVSCRDVSRDGKEEWFSMRDGPWRDHPGCWSSGRSSSTLRLITFVVGRIVSVATAFDEHPRVIVVAVMTWASRGYHLHGLLQLQLVLVRQPFIAVVVPRHRRRCRLIVTPSPLPPSDLRSSG